MNKYTIYFIAAIISPASIRCRTINKNVITNRTDIIGKYVNKISVVHFKENLELAKDSSFFLLTIYEWSKYEYKGVWKLKGDTLILECSSNIDLTDKKFFKDKWILAKQSSELLSLTNPNYSLTREH